MFPIVGVGASAGGIDAFTELLRHLPEAPGFALIYILHQEPKHESSLTSVIARASKMPVSTIADGDVIEPNHVYVGPPAADVTLEKGVFRIEQLGKSPTLPINHFLSSLAEDQGPRAIGVILSGSASDGTLGARAIKAEGGITFAQDDSAKFASMPKSAIAASATDFVLSPKGIAQELLTIARQFPAMTDAAHLPDADMRKVFAALRASRGIDFTHYKPSTIERRIRRRMALQRVDSLRDYLELIREKPAEIEELYGDLLIRVTGFFRDPAVFEALQREVLPKIFAGREQNDTVRFWVPGCATGEEVYSIAIAALETRASLGAACVVQIFGTDVSEVAIDHARSGVYSQSITSEISKERLRRFFTRADGNYRVIKTVRDCCIFAPQNVTKDPPFSRLDLISCRNVMIYLQPVLQRKVMSIFHYALQPDGFLLLGNAETITAYDELFDVIDRKAKIYRRKPGSRILGIADFETARPAAAEHRPRLQNGLVPAANPLRDADRVLLDRYAPPGVVINEDLEIVQFRGHTGSFLEPAQGTASFNLLKMLREGLVADVRAAIQGAKKKNAPQRREGVRLAAGGSTIVVNIEAVPFITAAQERMLIVLFEQVDGAPRKTRPAKKTPKASKEEPAEGRRLKRELQATREYLQAIIEQQEATNEELRSANEEIQSSNEELQSTNEELGSAKEELQSSNEELTTLNDELENRNQELAVLNNDLMNVFASVDVPVIMLDGALRVRRANPPAQRVANIAPADIGRPISELNLNLDQDRLAVLVQEVIDSLEVRSIDVHDRSGRLYSLRIRPYRTADNKIDGAVLVLVDIDQPRRSA